MSLHNLIVFLFAYLLATAVPGPAVAAILGRVLSPGKEGIVAFIAGFVVEYLTWFVLAAMGMAAIAQRLTALSSSSNIRESYISCTLYSDH